MNTLVNFQLIILLVLLKAHLGKGISVTQTQMLRAFTAIANDGVMLEPKFISAIYDTNNQSVRKSQKK